MAHANAGKGKERADINYEALKTGPGRELTTFEREALDHMPHADDALVIPIYCLCRLSDVAIADITKSVAEPDYAEPTGMKFKLINWKKPTDGDDLDMLRTAKRKRKGLLLFVDRQSLEQRDVRMTDYSIWDDGWGEEEMQQDGTKGEGLKWGRIMFPDLMRVYTDVQVGVAPLDKFIVGGPRAIRITRWGRLEVF